MGSRYLFLGIILVCLGVPVAFGFYPRGLVETMFHVFPVLSLVENYAYLMVGLRVASVFAAFLGCCLVAYGVFSKVSRRASFVVIGGGGQPGRYAVGPPLNYKRVAEGLSYTLIGVGLMICGYLEMRVDGYPSILYASCFTISIGLILIAYSGYFIVRNEHRVEKL